MFRNHAIASRAWSRPSLYSAKVQPLMQEVLRRLADIDFEHDAALGRLEASSEDAKLKGQLAERLKARHRERREPYVRMLTDLHARATRRTGLRRFL
jgi:hypothetical protein